MKNELDKKGVRTNEKGPFHYVHLFLYLFLSGQEIQEKATAVNIEVPVRMFEGNKFVENLGIDNFEIYEDGVLQKIEAAYLIKKTGRERHQELIEDEQSIKKFTPRINRNFILVFESTEYIPKTGEAGEYFFENILQSDDTLLVVTPAKSYRFNNRSFKNYSRIEMATQLKNKLRKHTILATRKFKSLLRDYEKLLHIPFEEDIKTQMLKDILRQLRNYIY